MSIIKRLSISWKLSILAIGLAGFFLTLSLGYAIFNIRESLIATTLETERVKIADEKDKVLIINDAIYETLTIMQEALALQKMTDDPQDNNTLDGQYARIEGVFMSEMRATGLYKQMRYVSTSGDVLVDVGYKNGQTILSSEESVVNISNTPYFESIINGGDNVSLMVIKSENEPVPVLVYGTSVFDRETNERQGVLVASVLFDQFIIRSGLQGSSLYKTYILDSDKTFTFYLDAENMWHFSEYANGGDASLLELLASHNEIFENTEGVVLDGETFFSYTKFSLGEEDSLKDFIVLNRSQQEVVFGQINVVARVIALVSFALFIILAFAFFLAIRYLLYPLKDLDETVRKLGEGDFSARVPVRSHDEIGRVASSFNSMAEQLEDLYDSMDKKIEERTNRLNLATKIAHIGVWNWDIPNNHLVWDDQMYALYGIRRMDFGGAYGAWQKGVDPDDWVRLNTEVNDAIMLRKPFDTTYRVIWPDGSVHDLRAFATVEYDEKTGRPLRMTGVNWDITKEKEIDRAKTEFVSLASHQLRTPLSSINWYTEMLLDGDGGKLTKTQRDFLQEIYQGNKRMVALVDDLLSVSRLEMGTFVIDPEKLDIVDVADSVLKELEFRIEEKKMKLRKDYEKVPVIYSDKNLLRMILQNLLTNAVKYTPENGQITLRLLAHKGELMIVVSDNGYGIPKVQQGRVFSKLFRADNVKSRDTDGTGLGLYIIKAIVERLGGEINFESEENVGTTFYVKIPLRYVDKTVEK